jgi:cell division protein FtsW
VKPLRRIITFFAPPVSQWAILPRLLHWLTFLWLFIGLAVLFSASYVEGEAMGDGFYYVKRQLVWLFLGLLGFNYVIHSPLKRILNVSHWFFLILLGMIFLIFLPGRGITVNGATRWLNLGFMAIQPSELIKPFLVLQSARIFGKWHKISPGNRLLWVSLFLLMLVGILLQPNLSMTALCGMTLWLVALAAAVPYLYLIPVALGGVGLATASIMLRSYQMKRIMLFRNPWKDAAGNGYQLVQSLLAIGSGGVWGKGFGLSQQKLFYLPIQYTDFIFAIFAEEFGFVGCVLLLLMLMVYATLALLVAFNARNPVFRLVAIGAMVLMVGQSLLNIGVATGVLPTTGLPLPLISYGGNSMLTSLFIAGLLIRVARESSEAEIVPFQQRRQERVV